MGGITTAMPPKPTAQTLYEDYLADRGWAPSTAPAWGSLQPVQRKAWERAAETIEQTQVPRYLAIRCYVALLDAVSRAP